MLNVNTVVELDNYLKRNPNLLNKKEKEQLKKQFSDFIKKPTHQVVDPLLEFFIHVGEVESKEDDFLNYIKQNYPSDRFPKVLEVATGKVCSLAQKLNKSGYRVTAMDPEIRIDQKDSRAKGVKLLKRRFTSDFRTEQYDVIVGYNACPVAGTLLSKRNIPTVFTICDGPQSDGVLDIGRRVSSKEDFIEELNKRDARIQKVNGLTIVDNSRIMEMNKPEHSER